MPITDKKEILFSETGVPTYIQNRYFVKRKKPFHQDVR
jgi:hypothetical protein